MENITVTADHVRRLRDSGPGHALFSDGDTVMVARESAETAGWMMIGRHERSMI